MYTVGYDESLPVAIQMIVGDRVVNRIMRSPLGVQHLSAHRELGGSPAGLLRVAHGRIVDEGQYNKLLFQGGGGRHSLKSEWLGERYA